MKKIGVYVLIGLLMVISVSAIPNPAPIYCEEMGYTQDETYCIFPDGERCELWAFFRGECGSEYIIDLPCTEVGYSLLPGYECCEYQAIGAAHLHNGACEFAIGGWPICSYCGDGECQDVACTSIGCPSAENSCNCPEDCGEIECRTEDDECYIGDVPCCEGLKEVGLCGEEDGMCICANCGSICRPCENRVCDEGENRCNCPQDCAKELTCSDLEEETDSNYYFSMCNIEGYDNVCFDKFTGEYQGCTKDSRDDCTEYNTNAERNILCDVRGSNSTCENIGTDMDECLDTGCYWDQENDKCFTKRQKCSERDGGDNIYEEGHTFGFRTHSTADDPERDLRIRTGGKDWCENGKLQEYYCFQGDYIAQYSVECPNGCSSDGSGACEKGELIREQITCIFEDSEKEQECYLAGQSGPNDEDTKFCKGIGRCVISFEGYEGARVTWKSTCGGYQYTTQDGVDEKVSFDCGGGEIEEEAMIEKGFRAAYWECEDGSYHKSPAEDEIYFCKSYGQWKKEAIDFCEGKCSSIKNENCGVKEFSLFDECYLEREVPIEIEPAEPEVLEVDQPVCGAIGTRSEGWTTSKKFLGYANCEGCVAECKLIGSDSEGWYSSCDGSLISFDICEKKPKEKFVVCKDSCSMDGKCYNFGYRKSGKYCSDEGSFVDQLSEDSECDNNFECSSNVCVNGQCVSGSLIQKIIDWFKNLFN